MSFSFCFNQPTHNHYNQQKQLQPGGMAMLGSILPTMATSEETEKSKLKMKKKIQWT